MTELEYKFTNDVLFKSLFVNNPDLLKKLVSLLLNIKFESIEQFEITNTDIPPELLGEKFCRLDINMTVNGKRIDLELQVNNEGDYPERSLYYWAREYSTALEEGEDYVLLPQTIIISILDFKLFKCEEFHSEFQALEVKRHESLTDKMCLHYYELLKLPKTIQTDDLLKLWLNLFSVETEEELKKFEALEVPEMQQTIGAYRSITVTPEFRELERLRSKARHNEAAALRHAKEEEREKWQGVVDEQAAIIAGLRARLGEDK